jgi:hypothetical protein
VAVPLSWVQDGIAKDHPTQEIDMTSGQKVARRKLSLLELAQELGNVSRACQVMGYSRQQFYGIRRNFQTYGAEGLIDRLPGTRGPHPNRVSAVVEQAVLDHAVAHPCHGALRVEQELRIRGLQVSSGGVRGVWQRHALLTKHDRLLRLEKATAEREIELSDEQVRLLERFSPEFRERHIEAPHNRRERGVKTWGNVFEHISSHRSVRQRSGACYRLLCGVRSALASRTGFLALDGGATARNQENAGIAVKNEGF